MIGARQVGKELLVTKVPRGKSFGWVVDKIFVGIKNQKRKIQGSGSGDKWANKPRL